MPRISKEDIIRTDIHLWKSPGVKSEILKVARDNGTSIGNVIAAVLSASRGKIGETFIRQLKRDLEDREKVYKEASARG